MIHAASLDALAAARRDGHWAVPLYEGFAFAQIPSLVASLFGDGSTAMAPDVVEASPRPRSVVVLLLDGFGWTFFERFADELPFLRRIVRDGVATKLSAQFPSTTAAHVTTLHTGAAVGASGVFEWQYLEPAVGEIFLPLPALAVGEDGLRPVMPEPGSAYPPGTFYERLRAAGVRSFCYQSARYARSTFSRAVTAGAEVVPFETLPEATVHLVERLESSRAPTYHCVYVDVIDAISHRFGPDSRFASAEIRALFQLLEDRLSASVVGTDALILITADHGHIAVDPRRTVYLDALCPDLIDKLHLTAGGRPCAPAGSARDQFLYVRPELVDEVHDELSAALDGLATVHRTDALVENGLFGQVGPRLRDRLAPLVVLPHPHEMVWWSGGGRFEQAMWGHHGGLSPDELEIPLLAWRP